MPVPKLPIKRSSASGRLRSAAKRTKLTTSTSSAAEGMATDRVLSTPGTGKADPPASARPESEAKPSKSTISSASVRFTLRKLDLERVLLDLESNRPDIEEHDTSTHSHTHTTSYSEPPLNPQQFPNWLRSLSKVQIEELLQHHDALLALPEAELEQHARSLCDYGDTRTAPVLPPPPPPALQNGYGTSKRPSGPKARRQQYRPERRPDYYLKKQQEREARVAKVLSSLAFSDIQTHLQSLDLDTLVANKGGRQPKSPESEQMLDDAQNYLQVPQEVSSTGFCITDSSGEVLVDVLPTGTIPALLLEQFEQSFKALCEDLPDAHFKISKSDKRFVEPALPGQAAGILHLSVWNQSTWQHERPAVSQSLRGDKTDYKDDFKHIRLQTFLNDNWELFKRLGGILKAHQPKLFDKYNAVELPSGIDKTLFWPFCMMALNRNYLSLPHKDLNDFVRGFCLLHCWGDFTGGDLTLKELRLKIPIQKGQVVLFRSAVLTQWNQPIEAAGIRHSMVLFTPWRMLEWRSISATQSLHGFSRLVIFSSFAPKQQHLPAHILPKQQHPQLSIHLPQTTTFLSPLPDHRHHTSPMEERSQAPIAVMSIEQPEVPPRDASPSPTPSPPPSFSRSSSPQSRAQSATSPEPSFFKKQKKGKPSPHPTTTPTVGKVKVSKQGNRKKSAKGAKKTVGTEEAEEDCSDTDVNHNLTLDTELEACIANTKANMVDGKLVDGEDDPVEEPLAVKVIKKSADAPEKKPTDAELIRMLLKTEDEAEIRKAYNEVRTVANRMGYKLCVPYTSFPGKGKDLLKIIARIFGKRYGWTWNLCRLIIKVCCRYTWRNCQYAPKRKAKRELQRSDDTKRQKKEQLRRPGLLVVFENPPTIANAGTIDRSETRIDAVPITVTVFASNAKPFVIPASVVGGTLKGIRHFIMEYINVGMFDPLMFRPAGSNSPFHNLESAEDVSLLIKCGSKGGVELAYTRLEYSTGLLPQLSGPVTPYAPQQMISSHSAGIGIRDPVEDMTSGDALESQSPPCPSTKTVRSSFSSPMIPVSLSAPMIFPESPSSTLTAPMQYDDMDFEYEDFIDFDMKDSDGDADDDIDGAFGSLHLRESSVVPATTTVEAGYKEKSDSVPLPPTTITSSGEFIEDDEDEYRIDEQHKEARVEQSQSEKEKQVPAATSGIEGIIGAAVESQSHSLLSDAQSPVSSLLPDATNTGDVAGLVRVEDLAKSTFSSPLPDAPSLVSSPLPDATSSSEADDVVRGDSHVHLPLPDAANSDATKSVESRVVEFRAEREEIDVRARAKLPLPDAADSDEADCFVRAEAQAKSPVSSPLLDAFKPVEEIEARARAKLPLPDAANSDEAECFVRAEAQAKSLFSSPLLDAVKPVEEVEARAQAKLPSPDAVKPVEEVETSAQAKLPSPDAVKPVEEVEARARAKSPISSPLSDAVKPVEEVEVRAQAKLPSPDAVKPVEEVEARARAKSPISSPLSDAVKPVEEVEVRAQAKLPSPDAVKPVEEVEARAQAKLPLPDAVKPVESRADVNIDRSHSIFPVAIRLGRVTAADEGKSRSHSIIPAVTRVDQAVKAKPSKARRVLIDESEEEEIALVQGMKRKAEDGMGGSPKQRSRPSVMAVSEASQRLYASRPRPALGYLGPIRLGEKILDAPKPKPTPSPPKSTPVRMPAPPPVRSTRTFSSSPSVRSTRSHVEVDTGFALLDPETLLRRKR
ncbi:hypothetical protein BJ508DRAFT_310337 [Ascobolus immersus RN42]|uniref:2OGFeDO JBP1/TET oxygenase domain-containing protein n=1 Tax=Ascobolus immersus RN42 TaxID=1160509 RepID=A0A3N4HZI5_ASCIM|nr:hypothetical protein BJ508DRAFT_310337 [Ascobolus immersus RN42]